MDAKGRLVERASETISASTSPAGKAEATATDAGFTRFRHLDIDHATNAFYEIRP